MLSTSLWDSVTGRTSSQHPLLFTGNPQGRSSYIFLEFQVGRNTLVKGMFFTQAIILYILDVYSISDYLYKYQVTTPALLVEQLICRGKYSCLLAFEPD